MPLNYSTLKYMSEVEVESSSAALPTQDSGLMRLKKRLAPHKQLLIRIFYIVMIAAVIFVAQGELRSISGKDMQMLLREQSPGVIIGFLFLGIIAFTATGLYDVFAARHFSVQLPLREALRTGWVAQAFNNFAGLGGLTGGTIRARRYQHAGADKKLALRITLAVWAANLLGLFLLLLCTLPLAVRWEGAFAIVPLTAGIYIPLYFFGQHIRIGKIDLSHSLLAKQNFRQKCEMAFGSVVDWLAAALFFWACLSIFAPEIGLGITIFIYVSATLVGLLSMLPAGIGSFDVTVIALFSEMGVNTEKLLLGIILFRIAYYVLPWLLALLVSVDDLASRRNRVYSIVQGEKIVNHLLSLGMLICGLVLIASTLVPPSLAQVFHFSQIIPHAVRVTSALTSMLIGVLLLILSVGLHRRIRRIYWATLILLPVGAISCITKGLHYEEAAVLFVFAVLLYLARDSFDAEPLRLTWPAFIISAAVFILLPLLLLVARHAVIQQMAPFYVRFISTGHTYWSRAVFYICLASLIAFLLLFSRSKKLLFTPPREQDISKFQNFLAQYGENTYSYLYALGDKEVFYNTQEDIAFLYRPNRGALIVLGDPLGDREALRDSVRVEEALAELFSYAEQHDMTVVFYEIAGKFLEPLIAQGLNILKIGEDAYVDLLVYSNVGNSGKVFRRMRNRMKQNGTHFEMLYPPFSADLLAELAEVSECWLGERHEMGFSLGYFDKYYLSNGPIGIVRSERRIEGFANIVQVGQEIASFDLMRFRPDAPGGTMDGILVSLIEWAKDQGYKKFNLGMAPLSGVGRHRYAHRMEKIVKLIHDFGDRFYNFRGLWAYKEKFKPSWQARYLAYISTKSLPSVLISLVWTINKENLRESTTPARQLIARNTLDARSVPAASVTPEDVSTVEVAQAAAIVSVASDAVKPPQECN